MIWIVYSPSIIPPTYNELLLSSRPWVRAGDVGEVECVLPLKTIYLAGEVRQGPMTLIHGRWWQVLWEGEQKGYLQEDAFPLQQRLLDAHPHPGSPLLPSLDYYISQSPLQFSVATWPSCGDWMWTEELCATSEPGPSKAPTLLNTLFPLWMAGIRMTPRVTLRPTCCRFRRTEWRVSACPELLHEQELYF